MHNKSIKLCLQIPLRDYPAFEDLANELGVDITDIKIVDDEPARKRAKPTGRKKRCTISPELREKILSYPDSMTFVAIRRQLRKEMDNPPSCSTISRIFQEREESNES